MEEKLRIVLFFSAKCEGTDFHPCIYKAESEVKTYAKNNC